MLHYSPPTLLSGPLPRGCDASKSPVPRLVLTPGFRSQAPDRQSQGGWRVVGQSPRFIRTGNDDLISGVEGRSSNARLMIHPSVTVLCEADSYVSSADPSQSCKTVQTSIQVTSQGQQPWSDQGRRYLVSTFHTGTDSLSSSLADPP
jgi:hypothetical protein